MDTLKIEIKSCNDAGMIIESLSKGIISIGEYMQVTNSDQVSEDNQNGIGGMLQIVGQVMLSAAKTRSLAVEDMK